MEVETTGGLLPHAVAAALPWGLTYSHLLFAALLPIVTAAFASLKRPLNTLTPKQKRALKEVESDDDDEDEEEVSAQVESLTATDALLFPVTAGAALGGLYLIIKWLNDPAILSKILGYYFCFMGVFAVGKAASDVLAVGVSFVFPTQQRVRGKVFAAGFDSYLAEDRDEFTSPSPLKLPQSTWPILWKIRRTLHARWTLDLKLHSLPMIANASIKKPFWIGDVIGPAIGTTLVGIYLVGGKHWLMTNIMGISFSYSAMQVCLTQPLKSRYSPTPPTPPTLTSNTTESHAKREKLLSPTTFPIASLLLGLLFFYDVFFVFYTPLMVTVATSLDVPIKLLFPRPGMTPAGKPALAMLGLGDIVLPGLVVAMALRYDLWRFYEVKRLALLKKNERNAKNDAPSKPAYTSATGGWGEYFWGAPIATRIPKPYFTASLAGYVVGLLTTLVVMHVFRHAQPALLYLVPGVIGALWSTAVVRGEARAMWAYTEEGEDEDSPADPDSKVDKEDKKDKKDAKKKDKKEKKPKKDTEDTEPVDCVVLRLIRRPAKGARRRKTLEEELRDAEHDSDVDANDDHKGEGETEVDDSELSISEMSGESEGIEVVERPEDE